MNLYVLGCAQCVHLIEVIGQFGQVTLAGDELSAFGHGVFLHSDIGVVNKVLSLSIKVDGGGEFLVGVYLVLCIEATGRQALNEPCSVLDGNFQPRLNAGTVILFVVLQADGVTFNDGVTILVFNTVFIYLKA